MLPTNGFLAALALFTILAVVAILGVLLARFLRRPQNLHPMDTPEGRAIERIRTEQTEAARADPDRPAT
jgi:hypothetical protein